MTNKGKDYIIVEIWVVFIFIYEDLLFICEVLIGGDRYSLDFNSNMIFFFIRYVYKFFFLVGEEML